jgi:hypothetical protein
VKKTLTLSPVFLLFIFSCGTNPTPTPASAKNIAVDSPSTGVNKIHEDALKILAKKPVPVSGYRFIIEGDFDGDGKKEKLIEHYFSQKTHAETNKFYEGLDDYDDLVTMSIYKEPFSFVLSDSKKVDTLHISSMGQLLGLSYLKNEGDLNGDGTDEVSYVINWADWSNLNTWHIATYKNNRWEELYSFPIWDWQLPDLPGAFNDYGLFGTQGKIVNAENDSINKLMETELMNFPGLVKKIKKNKIQITFKNMEASEETRVVDIRKPLHVVK